MLWQRYCRGQGLSEKHLFREDGGHHLQIALGNDDDDDYDGDDDDDEDDEDGNAVVMIEVIMTVQVVVVAKVMLFVW